MEDYERTEDEDEHWGIDHLKAEAAKDSSMSKQSDVESPIESNSTELVENAASKTSASES